MKVTALLVRDDIDKVVKGECINVIEAVLLLREFSIWNPENPKMDPATSVYMLKVFPDRDGEIRAYNRHYKLLGVVDDHAFCSALPFVVDTWQDYRPGSDGLVGNALFLEAK